MVDAFSELCCEVVFHPSYLAPLDGQFALHVHGGGTDTLQCTAKVHLYLYLSVYFFIRPPGTVVLELCVLNIIVR